MRVVGEDHWRPVAVPGCWEDAGVPKDHPGPVDYRTKILLPALAAGRRAWLRFGAVSYACRVYVDEQEVGRHVGMWDAFRVEITPAVPADGGWVVLRVRVEKPASLTAGPDSPHVPGTYPVRETLAGFLPYVWGHAPGGIWQDVELAVTGPTVLGDITAWGTPDGVVIVEAEVSAPNSNVKLMLTDVKGELVAEDETRADELATFRVRIPSPRPWSPRDPALYTVRLRNDDGDGDSDQRVVRVGLRRLEADAGSLLLNGDPIYPRMVLSWGWYPGVLHANPGPERVRRDLEKLKHLGFNGVKLCLWFPPQYYFDLADELGMLLWVELPMWLPRVSPHFRAQLFVETERLVRQACNHPSVILYTLGCELNSAVGDDVLGPLYARVKALVRDALVRDNSGSGEAYGGLLTEHADFYDHHLYGEPPYFRATLEHFAPAWREPKPWLFGEFCDLDTFRDLRGLGATRNTRPWWTNADPTVNPQGARWQYDVPEHESRLRENGFWERGSELAAISRKQALLHRKVTLEAVRLRPDTSGYVITGERDTPVSTAGVWDDLGEVKFEPAEFAAFNADLVLALGWDRRRDWRAGGDRPAYRDIWCHVSGSVVRPHLVLAHHGRSSAPACVEWTVNVDGQDPFAAGTHGPGARVAAGSVQELCVGEFRVPQVDRPCSGVLRARVWVGGELAVNTWRFWFFPSAPWADVGPVALCDPSGRLPELRDLAPNLTETWDDAVVVATRWTPNLEAYVATGGRVVLLADEAADCPLPLAPVPFWREAVKVLEPHKAWGDFPHQGWTDLQFAGCATDLALDTSRVRPGDARPILRRVDARTARVHDYATDLAWGAGRMLLTALRFEGSRGDQPSGLRRNTGASYLLSRWVRALRP